MIVSVFIKKEVMLWQEPGGMLVLKGKLNKSPMESESQFYLHRKG
jgi:hypothetical protein